MHSFDINELVEITIEIMILNSLKSLDNIPISRNDQNNIWNIIALRFFNEKLNLKNALKLKSWWKRNTNSFREKVLIKKGQKELFQFLPEQKFLGIIKMNKVSNLIVQITIAEWMSLQKYIGYYKRKKFNSKFDQFLNKKLENYKINCYLKSKYNWFSQNPKKILWSGVFVCIETDCQNIYNAKIKNKKIVVNQIESINNEHFCTIELNFEEKTTHTEKVTKTQRCSGTERMDLGQELVNKGVLNVLCNNIIENQNNQNNG
jgi:hypothetical protein